MSAVDAYLESSKLWRAEVIALRSVLLDCDVTEEIKWNKPCYGHDGNNIAIVQEMKNFLALMFFKGALLSDPSGVLEAQGPNSRSAMRICFRSVDDVNRLASTVATYVREAIANQEAGLEVGPPSAVVFVEELQDRIDHDQSFRAAFESLTPGRQREYNLHISSAKQASTRVARVEKYAERILEGRGLRDR